MRRMGGLVSSRPSTAKSAGHPVKDWERPAVQAFRFCPRKRLPERPKPTAGPPEHSRREYPSSVAPSLHRRSIAIPRSIAPMRSHARRINLFQRFHPALESRSLLIDNPPRCCPIPQHEQLRDSHHLPDTWIVCRRLREECNALARTEADAHKLGRIADRPSARVIMRCLISKKR